MAHKSIKIIPGVTETETQALNETGITFSQLIRFVYDPQMGALIQKLGGWVKYYGSTLPAAVRSLWAWQDLNIVSHLAVGTQTGSGGSAQLSVITNGSQSVITPATSVSNPAVAASTTSNSSTVILTDATTTNVTSYDAVYIQTHISVGGVVLFGLYACTFVGTTQYSVQAADILGNQILASSTTSSASVALFNVTAGLATVTVTLANHGYNVGSTYPILVSTTVGGVTLYGNYIVQTVTSTSVFTISATNTASSTTSGSINGGNMSLTYAYGYGTPPTGTGYGVGGYGSGGWGGGTAIAPAMGVAVPATDWSLGNWGGLLMASPVTNTNFQPLYVWDPLTGSSIAAVVATPQAPTIMDGFFVAMPSRQVVCWGTSLTGIQDPLLIRWCDVNNYGIWVDLVTNQAGQYRIATGSRIVSCIQGAQEAYIWTDVGLWTMQYIGQPYIYSFTQIGFGCGLIGRRAAGMLNGSPYWMGFNQFYTLGADGPSIIECPVWDIAFQNIDTSNTNKIRCAVNSRFSEVAWYIPTLSSNGEVSVYVKYNTLLNVWDYGSMARSAWIDQSILGAPIGADPSTLYIYQHETTNNADGVAMNSSFTTGYAALTDGDNKVFIDEIWPDMKWGLSGGSQNANINITFNSTDFPGTAPVSSPTYTVSQSTQTFSPRVRARLLSFTIGSSDLGSFWRLGLIRYRGQPAGRYN